MSVRGRRVITLIQVAIVLVLCLATMMSMVMFVSAGGSTAVSGKRCTLALVTKSLDNPFWEYMHRATRQLAEERGFDLIYLAPTKPYNLEEQTRLVDDLIQKKVDGIVLVPVDSVGMVAAVKRANAAGIPVACANTRLEGAEIVTFTAVENYDGMKIVTEYMVEKLGRKGKIVILEGEPGSQTAIDIARAQRDVISKYPEIELLASQPTYFSRAKALEVMENLLQTYPKIDAVLCADDQVALGALEALEAAGRLTGVLVSGWDATADAIRAVMEGRLTVTCDQRPEAQATLAAEAILDYLVGKEVDKKPYIEATLVDKSNVDDYKWRLEGQDRPDS